MCVPVCVVAGAPLSVKLVWFRFKACRVFVCVYYIRKCVCVSVPWQVHPRPSSWCDSGSKPAVCLCVCITYASVCVCVPWQVHPRPSSWCGSGSKPVVCLCVCVTYVSVCACVCHGRCTLVRQAGVVQVQACCAQM